MYTLKDFLTSILSMRPDEVRSDEMFCSESNTQLTLLTNQMQQPLAAYSYTLVRRGWVTLVYNGEQLTLRPGDLLIYSPGFQISIVSTSRDYHSVCLIVNEQAALEVPTVRSVVLTAYHPVAELGQPVVHLDELQAAHFWRQMQEIIRYQRSSHRFLRESLRALFSLFLLDLLDAMERNIGHAAISERSTELFIAFMRLLPLHFIEHHDLPFYAGQLHITTVHLSRIVRQMTGRTVADYINQMLFMEATWLLQSTDLPVAAIAERLHFSDQSSFARFFARMRGLSPTAYRKRFVC